MAVIQASVYSKTLKRVVPFNALVPLDLIEIPGVFELPKGPMKALYFLHGYSGNHNDILIGTNMHELSLKYNLAVFMPSGENSFYLDDPERDILYAEFVGNELLEITRKFFPLSAKREDTFIGGFSMGGYGAVRNGLKYSANFSRILAFSAALITYNLVTMPPGFNDGIAPYSYYDKVFGPLDKLLGSDKDPEALIKKIKTAAAPIPTIYMACGEEDFLLELNRKFHAFLESEKIDHIYQETPGAHDWAFINANIENAIKWAVQ